MEVDLSLPTIGSKRFVVFVVREKERKNWRGLKKKQKNRKLVKIWRERNPKRWQDDVIYRNFFCFCSPTYSRKYLVMKKPFEVFDKNVTKSWSEEKLVCSSFCFKVSFEVTEPKFQDMESPKAVLILSLIFILKFGKTFFYKVLAIRTFYLLQFVCRSSRRADIVAFRHALNIKKGYRTSNFSYRGNLFRLGLVPVLLWQWTDQPLNDSFRTKVQRLGD